MKRDGWNEFIRGEQVRENEHFIEVYFEGDYVYIEKFVSCIFVGCYFSNERTCIKLFKDCWFIDCGGHIDATVENCTFSGALDRTPDKAFPSWDPTLNVKGKAVGRNVVKKNAYIELRSLNLDGFFFEIDTRGFEAESFLTKTYVHAGIFPRRNRGLLEPVYAEVCGMSMKYFTRCIAMVLLAKQACEMDVSGYNVCMRTLKAELENASDDWDANHYIPYVEKKAMERIVARMSRGCDFAKILAEEKPAAY